jgi:hypothetical protein
VNGEFSSAIEKFDVHKGGLVEVGMRWTVLLSVNQKICQSKEVFPDSWSRHHLPHALSGGDEDLPCG